MNLTRILFCSAGCVLLLLGVSACGGNQTVSPSREQVVAPSSGNPQQREKTNPVQPQQSVQQAPSAKRGQSGGFPNKSGSSQTEQEPADRTSQRTFFTNMDMIDAQTGFVSGYAKGTFSVWKTTDGGSHWKRRMVPYIPAFSTRSDAPPPPAVLFRSEKDGWMAWVAHGKKQNTLIVLHTSDGGQHWTKHVQTVLSVANYAEQINFSSGRDGWIRLFSGGVMNQGDTTIYHTADGGKSWTLVSSAGGYVPNKRATPHALPAFDTPMPMVFTDAKNGWVAVGSPVLTGFASLYRTETAGRTWDSVPLPVPKAFDDGFNTAEYQPVFSGKSGTVVVQFKGAFEKAVVYHTTNGGKAWIAGKPAAFGKQDYSIEQSFINPDIGWIIGRSGDSLQHTVNGGASWSMVPIGDALKPFLSRKYFVSRLDMVTSRTGWIVLERNDLTPAKILKTTDGGHSWTLTAVDSGTKSMVD